MQTQYLRRIILYARNIHRKTCIWKKNRDKSVKKQFFGYISWKMVQKFENIFLFLQTVRVNKFY